MRKNPETQINSPEMKDTHNHTTKSDSQILSKKRKKNKQPEETKKRQNKKIQSKDSPEGICLGSGQDHVSSAITPIDSTLIPSTPLNLSLLSSFLPFSLENFSVLSPFPLPILDNDTDLLSSPPANQTVTSTNSENIISNSMNSTDFVQTPPMSSGSNISTSFPPQGSVQTSTKSNPIPTFSENSTVSTQNQKPSSRAVDDVKQDLSTPSDLKTLSAEPELSVAEYFYEQARSLTKGFPKVLSINQQLKKEKAVEYLQIAACMGYPKAQYELGLFYFKLRDCVKGNLAERKYQTAIFEWYKKAADQNLAIAQCRLGDCYADGYGVEKDYCKAFQLYRLAEKHEPEAAQLARKRLIDHLLSVSDESIDPFLKYTVLAEEGYPAWQLGDCYRKGIGLNQG